MQFRELRIEASKTISDHGVIPPDLHFRWTAHHVRSIFSLLLPRGYVFDGSSVVQLNYGPRGDEPQYIASSGSTVYYVEDFDFVAYRSASANDRERILLLSIESALCSIASRAGVDDAIVRMTCKAVADCGFSRSIEIPKLRKFLRSSSVSLRVFRCLASNVGEAWFLRAIDRNGATIAAYAMNKPPGYLNRSDIFKTAELVDDSYVVRDRLGRETFRTNVAGLSAESAA